jgi:hypothetical protein
MLYVLLAHLDLSEAALAGGVCFDDYLAHFIF